jgi:hypothetical protein
MKCSVTPFICTSYGSSSSKQSSHETDIILSITSSGI